MAEDRRDKSAKRDTYNAVEQAADMINDRMEGLVDPTLMNNSIDEYAEDGDGNRSD